MTNDVYIFSGLGADERVFQHLDFNGMSATFVKWISPLENESIEKYASRLLHQIKSPRPILIGLSFGGLMAIEVAKQIDTEKVILISSAKTKSEIPYYYRFIGLLGLHKLMPSRLLLHSNFIVNWFFGVSNRFDKDLLKSILFDTDPIFFKWAIDKIIRWKNQMQIKNIFHIHGTRDKILPSNFLKCNILIPNGGHFLVLNKSDKVNEILGQQLQRTKNWA